MAEDLKNIRLSIHASDIAEIIQETGAFEDRISVAKFALGYALKYFADELTQENIEKLDEIYDASGSNYNIGSIDEDNFLSNLMSVLYPDSNTPYRYVRVIMCFGLNKLGDLYESGRLFPISEIM